MNAEHADIRAQIVVSGFSRTSTPGPPEGGHYSVSSLTALTIWSKCHSRPSRGEKKPG